MTRFLIDIELDGYDDYEEMLNSLNEGDVSDALENHGYTVISVKKNEEPTSETGTVTAD